MTTNIIPKTMPNNEIIEIVSKEVEIGGNDF